MTITIELDYDDFERLRVNEMAWQGHGWHDMPDRFRAVNGGEVDWSYWRAYWFADAASMILAREYLRACGELCQVLADEADDGHSRYVIVANV